MKSTIMHGSFLVAQVMSFGGTEVYPLLDMDDETKTEMKHNLMDQVGDRLISLGEFEGYGYKLSTKVAKDPSWGFAFSEGAAAKALWLQLHDQADFEDMTRNQHDESSALWSKVYELLGESEAHSMSSSSNEDQAPSPL